MKLKPKKRIGIGIDWLNWSIGLQVHYIDLVESHKGWIIATVRFLPLTMHIRIIPWRLTL